MFNSTKYFNSVNMGGRGAGLQPPYEDTAYPFFPVMDGGALPPSPLISLKVQDQDICLRPRLHPLSLTQPPIREELNVTDFLLKLNSMIIYPPPPFFHFFC